LPISLSGTVISNADATTGWAVIPNASTLAGGTVPQLEGSDSVSFDIDASNDTGGLQSPTVTAFDLRNNEVGIWFLNPKKDADNNELISQEADALRLRVYAGTNFADYNQGFLRDTNNEYPGGWLYLRASGAAGTEDTNSGTWTNTQAGAITSVGVFLRNDAPNNDKSDTEYHVDYVKYSNKIIVTGFNGGTTPWTLGDIYDASIAGDWGLVEKTENFYRFYCGLEFGDGSAAGAFDANNEYIFLDHSSADLKYDVTVKNNFTVTLGVKNVQTQATYAQDGVQLVSSQSALYDTAEPRPSLSVEAGGNLNCYATLIQGFGNVALGDGTGNIELVGVDMYENTTVQFRSTQLSADNIRVHTLSTDKGNLGVITETPISMTRVQVFNSNDALEFQQSFSVTEYVASDNTFDVLIQEGDEMSLINSSFDPAKLKRTT
jgi:hypothetical protein